MSVLRIFSTSVNNQAPSCEGAFPLGCLISAALVVIRLPVTSAGSELCSRERNPREHLAGIFRATGGIAAFLGGNCIIQHRNDQLRIPLQADNGELSQSDVEAFALPCDHQFIIKHLADWAGQLQSTVVPALALAHIPHFGAEYHGIQGFHHGGGAVGIDAAGTIRTAQTGIGAVNVGLAVLTAEHRPLGKYGNTI